MPPNDRPLNIKTLFTWFFVPLVLGGVGFAHGSIWAHDKEIAVLKSQQENMREAARDSSERSDKRMERIENVLNEILKEMRKP